MKKQYRVRGILEIGDMVRMTLEPFEAVKEKTGMLDILSNPSGMVDKMKMDAIMTQQPDILTIPKVDWEEYKWIIDSIVVVDISSE